MEDYPPASESRAGSYSALSPQSNLYRPALRHSIFPPPCFRNRQTVFSLALLLGVPLLPGGNNCPLELVASIVLAAQTNFGITQTCAKAKPFSLPDEEDADEASSVLINSSVSLLFSSLDMLMAVI